MVLAFSWVTSYSQLRRVFRSRILVKSSVSYALLQKVAMHSAKGKARGAKYVSSVRHWLLTSLIPSHHAMHISTPRSAAIARSLGDIRALRPGNFRCAVGE